jgi:hypothetical protein
MGWRTIAARATRIGALALVAACASSSSSTVTGGAQTAGDSVPAQGTVVTVLNTSPSATTITVYMKPEIGVDTPLGTVEAGESRTFAYDGLPGFYQIRTVGSNGERTSTRFQLFRNSSIRWDMSAGGRVVVGRRDPI